MDKPLHFDVADAERKIRASSAQQFAAMIATRKAEGKDAGTVPLQRLMAEVQIAAALATMRAVNDGWRASEIGQTLGHTIGNVLANFAGNIDRDGQLFDLIMTSINSAMRTIGTGQSTDKASVVRTLIEPEQGGKA